MEVVYTNGICPAKDLKLNNDHRRVCATKNATRLGDYTGSKNAFNLFHQLSSLYCNFGAVSSSEKETLQPATRVTLSNANPWYMMKITWQVL